MIKAAVTCVWMCLVLGCEPVTLGSDVTGGAAGAGAQTGGSAARSSGGLGGAPSAGGGTGNSSAVLGGSGGGAPGGTGARTPNAGDSGGSIPAAAGCPGAAGCGANSGAAGDAHGPGGAAGAGGTAAGAGGTAGAGGAAGAGGTGATAPEGAEPPTDAPITAMCLAGSKAVAGDFVGRLFCRDLTAGAEWTLCNATNPSRTTVLPSRPVSALWTTSYGLAYVALVPETADDTSVYMTGYLEANPWAPMALQGVTVYGMTEVPSASPWRVAVTSGGIYQADSSAGPWVQVWGANLITAALLVPEGLLSGAWIGTEQGLLAKVDDPVTAPSDAHWVPMNAALPAAPVVGITMDPDYAARAYVTAASVSPSGLYASRDGGYTFTATSLPFSPEVTGALSAVSVNPFAPDVLYLLAFTPDPVPLRSMDAGQTWQVVSAL